MHGPCHGYLTFFVFINCQKGGETQAYHINSWLNCCTSIKSMLVILVAGTFSLVTDYIAP